MSASRILFSCALALALAAGVADAQERSIYTWTDEKGNLHMTDEPPPANASLREVETWSERDAEGARAVDRELDQRRRRWAAEDRREALEEARREAEAAERGAQAALQRAQELTREAQAYIERFGNTPERRQQFKYKIQARKEMALAAQQAARDAQASAEQARRRVQELQAEMKSAGRAGGSATGASGLAD